MTALLDTNVVLDVLLERLPFFDDSAAIWKASDDGRLDAHISAVTVTTIFYVARKVHGAAKAREAVGLCLSAFRIAAVDRAVLQSAMVLSGGDFEDNVQLIAAQTVRVDVVVTRNPGDFAASTLPVLSPRELLMRLQA